MSAFYALPDEDREAWIARWERRAERCQHHGGPKSECDDPDKLWYPQRRLCRSTMERMAADERYRRLHEKKTWHDGTFQSWRAEPVYGGEHPHPYRYDMGITIVVTETDENPADDFLTRVDATPLEETLDPQQEAWRRSPPARPSARGRT